MKRWLILAFSALLTISPVPGAAEKAICSSAGEFVELFGTDVYEIDASRDTVSVTHRFVRRRKTERETKDEILGHWFPGMEGTRSLGISFIMLRFPDADPGTAQFPAMIVVDWGKLRFAHSYVPLLSFMANSKDKFVIARTDYDCVRLD